jgi:hypothetical protein
MRPELEVSAVTEEDELLHIGALFAKGSGDFEGWLVSRRVSGQRERHVFCHEGTGDPMIGAIYCGAPEAIKKQAVLTTEEVLLLFSRLIENYDAIGYQIISLSDAIMR